ncbi:hypothetical protein BJ928_1011193 [Rhizobium sp. WW_1]|jgi:aryl-alcohol dehydrogenase-like predicted oxidoreductase|nr:hypothetical protein BJ928_1011193 [Rhizobium sp. WW_1]
MATGAVVGAILKDRGVSPARVASAWVVGKLSLTSAIFGLSKLHNFSEDQAALLLRLSGPEIRSVEAPMAAPSGAQQC